MKRESKEHLLVILKEIGFVEGDIEKIDRELDEEVEFS